MYFAKCVPQNVKSAVLSLEVIVYCLEVMGERVDCLLFFVS